MVPLNLPNVLTLLRILAVPVIVVALLGETPNGDALAAGVFALAALTDGLDGYIARSRQSRETEPQCSSVAFVCPPLTIVPFFFNARISGKAPSISGASVISVTVFP